MCALLFHPSGSTRECYRRCFDYHANPFIANIYNFSLHAQNIKQGQFELFTSLERVSLDAGSDSVSFCDAERDGIDSAYIIDLDGSLRPSAMSTTSISTLISNGAKMQNFVDPEKCIEVSEGCLKYCRDTCFRSVRYEVEPDGTEEYKLKVCKDTDSSDCSQFEWGRRENGNPGGNLEPRTFIAHVPVGYAYNAVFLDDDDEEVMPSSVLEKYEESLCPSGKFSVKLVDRLPETPPTSPPPIQTLIPATIQAPTNIPTSSPTDKPTSIATNAPSQPTAKSPTVLPTDSSSPRVTPTPTPTPTISRDSAGQVGDDTLPPTKSPRDLPTDAPSAAPTDASTLKLTQAPTPMPATTANSTQQVEDPITKTDPRTGPSGDIDLSSNHSTSPPVFLIVAAVVASLALAIFVFLVVRQKRLSKQGMCSGINLFNRLRVTS